jgi:DNA-binding NtrC family response regulator
VRHRGRILVVDDDTIQRQTMAVWLKQDGYTVDTAASGEEAVRMTVEVEYAVCLVDLKMPPGMNGIDTMREIRKMHPDAAVVIVTAYATIDTAVRAIKEGAQDYMVKPCNPHEISLVVERLIKLRHLERENVLLRKKLTEKYTFHDIVSKNATMHEIFDLVRNVATLKSTVLIQGESGTGKEMIARAIHYASDRKAEPFVAVACSALAEGLLESELFGQERGSFTGAVGRKKGKFEMADGGTVLLDEIGDISPKLQVDLLRVLEERRFFRVGGSEELEVDVRVIAASNRNLQECVRAGSFRDDLFYRLNVITIELPALRDRSEDIPLLAQHFVGLISAELGKEVRDIADDAIRRLMLHDWPGNVRELRNAVERAMIVARTPVLSEEDFSFLRREADAHTGWCPPGFMTLREVEQRMIEATLLRTEGNIKEAASRLGIDRSTLYEKIKRYGIRRP